MVCDGSKGGTSMARKVIRRWIREYVDEGIVHAMMIMGLLMMITGITLKVVT